MTEQTPGADSSHPLDTEGIHRLLDVARRINAEANPQAVLETIVDSLVAITRADRGFLMLKGPDGELHTVTEPFTASFEPASVRQGPLASHGGPPSPAATTLP